MTSPAGLRFKTFLLLSLMIVFGPLGDVLLGKGMKRVGAPTGFAPVDLFHFFFRAFTSQTVWFGIGALLTFFLAYICVLSWADYSYVQPASSMAYGVVALLGYLVLGEPISPVRWIGVLTICAGVFIVGHTPPRTTESGPC
jgi:drug/metabolite transporter (DMT)-like permease